jgi:N-acetylglutamate synthase-like GNAT family acetyltransferase
MIREAVSKDIKPITKLLGKYAEAIDFPFVKSIAQDNVRNYMVKETCIILISKDDKEINGILLGQVVTNGFTTEMMLAVSAIYITDVIVDKDKKAKALMNQAKNWGKKRDVVKYVASLFDGFEYGLVDNTAQPEVKTFEVA